MGCSSSTFKTNNVQIIYDQNHYDIENHIDDFYGLLVTGFIHRESSISFNDILLCLRYYREKDLVVKENTSTTLISANPNVYYLFNTVKLEENSTLTVSAWNKDTELGGYLYIICSEVQLLPNSHINLNGKGYSGGKGVEGGYCGYSYDGISTRTHRRNFGGGGGVYVEIENPQAGGGAHTTKGIGGKNKVAPNSEGGEIYKKKGLCLGSGGGSCIPQSKYGNGGSGGGALRIQCFGKFMLYPFTAITCNGSIGDSVNCGAGSGGTICLILKDWKNLMFLEEAFIIHALGGKYRQHLHVQEKKKKKYQTNRQAILNELSQIRRNNENQGDGGDGKIMIITERYMANDIGLLRLYGSGLYQPNPMISTGANIPC